MNSPNDAPSATWPYPRWIAHRGAGKLAPENTLAAFRLGASHGFRMFECDVKLSADGEPFLLHDADLDRTTSGHGPAGDQPWDELSRLDAGSWHSAAYAGEPLLRLQALARWLQANGLLVNLEIKPSPGLDEVTGRVVAQAVRRLWTGQTPMPLLSSFNPSALRSAREAAPEVPRALLLETLRTGWVDEALSLGSVAVVAHHAQWTAEGIALAHQAGLKALTYTVNEVACADELWAAGLDGLITDRVDLMGPRSPA
ncbi:glycerophosphodiester phosphodiesterase [Aquabacterium sp.]|uniref:glycerophosphodiester phosphodiesterase n=1 Tax=Aquabacterium sp. TaxID=1872578 RepID=UPI003D6D0307